jgi:hypothetical protein
MTCLHRRPLVLSHNKMPMHEARHVSSSMLSSSKTLTSMTKYAVYRVYRDWNKRPAVLMDNLTREQAQIIVRNTPSEEDSMVVFDKMK